jgi:hypothetical protein
MCDQSAQIVQNRRLKRCCARLEPAPACSSNPNIPRPRPIFRDFVTDGNDGAVSDEALPDSDPSKVAAGRAIPK